MGSMGEVLGGDEGGCSEKISHLLLAKIALSRFLRKASGQDRPPPAGLICAYASWCRTSQRQVGEDQTSKQNSGDNAQTNDL